MKISRFLLTLLLVAVTCGCRTTDIFPAFINSTNIHLEVNGVTQLEYDMNRHQIGFNRNRGQFRMCSDTMSDYFTLTMNLIPSVEGETIKADLCWTTANDVKTRKNIALEVVRTEGDKYWLWNDSERIALVIQVLE